MIEEMFVSFDFDKIRTKKLLIATPMYGGSCSGEFCNSLFETTKLFTKNEIPHDFKNILGESLIPRARNELADLFLRGDHDYLLFIDSDISFNPEDILSLLEHAVKREDMEIICAPYPLKSLNWEAIHYASSIVPKELLEMFTGNYFINYTETQKVIKLSEPVKILYGGTGFMLIKRSAFEKIREKRQDLVFLSDRKQSIKASEKDGENINPEMMNFFQCGVDLKTRQYLSEDYMFSDIAREAGVETWLVPNIDLSHIGVYKYSGSLRSISFLQERAMKAQTQQNP